MLQRIQSIYLFAAGLVIAALFIFPLINNAYVDGQALTIKVTGVYQNINGQQAQTQFFTALTIGTALVALLPLVVVFMYKDRKKQINFCYLLMLINIGYSYWAAQVVKNTIGDAYLNMSNYGVGIILLSVSLILIVLGQKSIQKDEKLVRSADRLR
ncbi:MAG: DUF4293 domain-containing protein [Bacteroidota bacterium]